MHLKEKFLTYLEAYAEKNIQKVADCFAEDIRLRDWKISVVGKDAALMETQKNFSAASAIEIEVLSLYESQNGIAGELKITVDCTEILYVVDVLTFDERGQVDSIHAYIGRAD
ncbi:MAG: hypothetical protein CMF25_08190 [Kangiellaceae bacterium]|nr:hypothetical protein [Kangiellaceae bacterium]|tara:strand:- start:126 stop:464 length:339 start_codon:yes stop_codon:yes gene_type:complete